VLIILMSNCASIDLGTVITEESNPSKVDKSLNLASTACQLLVNIISNPQCAESFYTVL
jgi:hypothetical protein